MALLTFLIPVRHQDNARDWGALKKNLTQTAASISAQTNPDWRCLVIANEGADLPVLPGQFDVVRVDFPPNSLHERESGGKEDFLAAFRIDKGRRVLKGMLEAEDSRFFMIVDDDDLVSARIVQFVSDHADQNGWRIDRGFIWDDGGCFLYEHDDFNHVCGTSLIIRSELFRLPDRFEDADPSFIRTMLGSHIRIAKILAERGTPLEGLPFRGAVYRVAHKGSHSRTPSLMRKYILTRANLCRPWRLPSKLARLRLVDSAAKQEFFGAISAS